MSEPNSPSSSLPSNTATDTSIPTPKPPLLQQPGPRLFLGGAAFALFSALSTRRALLRRRTPTLTPQFTTVREPLSTRTRSAPQQEPQTSPLPNASQNAGETIPRQAVSQAATHANIKPTQAPPQPLPRSEEQHSARPEGPRDEPQHPEDAPGIPGPILALEALSLATVNVVSWAMLVSGGVLWYFDVQGLEDLRRRIRGGLGVDGTGRSEREAEEEVEEWIVGVLARKEDKEMVKGRMERELRDGKGRDRSVSAERG